MRHQNKQAWIGALLVLAGFVAIQWHDNYTEQLIAQADAKAAQAIVASIQAHGVECGAPVVLTEVAQ